jgi:3-oxoacyl-[acyl-carrier-protein] synthase II
MGLASPLGLDVETYFWNLLAGKSGMGPITHFDVSAYPVQFAAEVKGFDPTTCFDAKEAQRTSRYIQYLMHAALQAVKQAGLDLEPPRKERAGMILGSGMGGIEIFTENTQLLGTKGPKRVSPFFIPMSITNMGAGMVGIRLGWKGPNFCITASCTSSEPLYQPPIRSRP